MKKSGKLKLCLILQLNEKGKACKNSAVKCWNEISSYFVNTENLYMWMLESGTLLREKNKPQ